MEEIIFKIILHAGDARSACMNAMKCLKTFDIAGCEALLKEAAHSLKQAHQVQTALIQEEVRGNPQDLSLLMVHAQDHLMSALAIRDTVSEMMFLTQAIDARFKTLEAAWDNKKGVKTE